MTIFQEVHGFLLTAGERAALLLDPVADRVYLRYAFVERGSEQHILPESVLDDWGHELNTLSLFDWVLENGSQFPRAEVFGFTPNGADRQRFLRELDLASGLVCYVYDRPNSPIADGVAIEAVFSGDAQSGIPRRTVRPSDVVAPLARTRVSWWTIQLSEGMKIDLEALFEAVAGGPLA